MKRSTVPTIAYTVHGKRGMTESSHALSAELHYLLVRLE